MRKRNDNVLKCLIKYILSGVNTGRQSSWVNFNNDWSSRITQIQKWTALNPWLGGNECQTFIKFNFCFWSWNFDKYIRYFCHSWFARVFHSFFLPYFLSIRKTGWIVTLNSSGLFNTPRRKWIPFAFCDPTLIANLQFINKIYVYHRCFLCMYSISLPNISFSAVMIFD